MFFWDYIRTLNLIKLWNFCLVFITYHVSRLVKNSRLRGMPVSISIEPTTACNLGCPECPSGLKQFTRPQGNLSEDFFKKTIDSLYKKLTYITFYFQGEPFINPKFLDMVSFATSKNIYTATSTNAHFITKDVAEKVVKSGLKKLIVSLDGITQETYEKYRVSGNLSKVLEGTKNIIEAKQKLKSSYPRVVFQFLVVSHNEHEIDEAKQLAKTMRVDDVVFKTAQVYDYKNGNPLIPKNEKYSRYRKLTDGTFTIKNKLLNQCWRMWQGCVITWDGLIVPCCFDKDAKHQLGDLKSQKFEEIWLSEKYTDFRNSILKSRKEIDICTNCTEGTKVFES